MIVSGLRSQKSAEFRILFFYPYIIMSNFFTKLTSAVSVATLVAVSTSASFVSAASEFLDYAEMLADNNYIRTQSTESGYRLGSNVTRAEMAKVVANIGAIDAVECSGDVFGDVGPGLGDLCGYIEALAEAGIVSDVPTLYRPVANVTRAEMVKMILGALGEEGSDVDAGYMDTEGLGDLAMYINRAYELDCVGGADYFRPNATSTRGEAFKVAVICAGLDVDTTPVPPVPPVGTGSTGTGVVVAGALTVTLSGSAMAQYVPKNASSVRVGTVVVMAGSSNVTVNSLTINRSGLGNSAGLTISVGQNGMVTSESRSVNTATQDAIVRFNNPVVVMAGTSASFDVFASFDSSSTENSQHQFTLKAIGTTASVTGLPVTLGLLNTTSYSVSTTKVVQLDFNSVTSGKNDQSLGTVKLQAGAKDITLSAFTVSKTAGIDLTRALSNVSVLKNGTKVGMATITSDKIYVTGLNTKVLRNDTVTFELRADITYVGAGGGSDDIYVDILETNDVSAVEDLTGYATATDLTGANVDVIALSSLDIVFTKNTTKSVTVAPGTTNVTLFDAKIVSSATFDVTSFTLDGVAGLANTNNDVAEAVQFTSLTLTVNGVDYDLLTTTQNGGVGTYNFAGTSDKFRMDPGAAVNVKLVGNLANGASVGTYSYNVALNVVKNISTGNTVTLAGKNITGDTVTVSAPTLVLKKSTVSAPTTTKIYGNATNTEIARFGLEAKAEDITVREITFTNSGAANFINDFTDLVSGTNVKLINVADGSQVSASVTVSASEIKLTGMSIKVIKDSSGNNYKLWVDTQGDLVSALGANNKFNANVDIVSVSVASSASVTITNDATFVDPLKIYTAGTVPPTVTLVKTADNVFKVTISNTDQDNDIVLASITAQVRPVADNNSSYTANTCLRDEGSTLKCDDVGITSGTGSVPGAAKAFTITETIAKNSSITKEIYVDSNFVNPPTLQAEVSKVNYDATSETYSVIKP